MMEKMPLQFNEQTAFELRALYDSCGYVRYKMSKFEEYDLYAHNKDFLISDGVITFTDTNGKLMALKPDVTLSIIKNSRDGEDGTQKLYYNENVYRVSKSSDGFKEIMQVGLECIGKIDDYCIFEVLRLAVKSLCMVSSDCVLDLSDLGLLSDVMDACGIRDADKGDVLHLIGEKNIHELENKCRVLGLNDEDTALLQTLTQMCGSPDKVLPKLIALIEKKAGIEKAEKLSQIINSLDPETRSKIRIDFSAVDDIRYYNGIVFKGFVSGIPNAVLSGGRYDGLMHKMGRSSGALGFAVYLDSLERLNPKKDGFDVDALLLYKESDELASLAKAVEKLYAKNMSVLVQRCVPSGIRYGKLLELCGEEVKTIEENA